MRSAIATGLVDYKLPPAEMPAQLIAYTTYAFGKPPRPAHAVSKAENALKESEQKNRMLSELSPDARAPGSRTGQTSQTSPTRPTKTPKQGNPP